MASRYINGCKGIRPYFVSVFKSGESIGGFSRLGNNDHQIIFCYKRISVSKFRSNIHNNGSAGHFLNNVFSHHSRMHCRTAADYIYIFIIAEHFIGKSAFLKARYALFVNSGRKGIFKSGGLFVDFLKHKMLKAALLSRRFVPFRSLQLLFYNIFVNIVKGNAVFVNFRNFSRLGQKILICIFKNCGNVRGDEHFSLAFAHNKGTFLTHRKDLVFMLSEYYAQRISALKLSRSHSYCFDRIAVVVVIQQLCHRFGIRLAFKGIAL